MFWSNTEAEKNQGYKMNVLDLFSGIGGFSLGLERTGGFQTVAFCEIEKYPQQILRKHWPDVPIYTDIKELSYEDGRLYSGKGGPGEVAQAVTIDVICGGFPCQPYSVAGKQRGKDDDRALWPEMYRVIQESNPRWCILENVPGIINLGLDTVLSDLESAGYEVETFIIPACAINACHQRSRVWVVAHSIDGRPQERWPETNGEMGRSAEIGEKTVFIGAEAKEPDPLFAHDRSERAERLSQMDENKEERTKLRAEPCGVCSGTDVAHNAERANREHNSEQVQRQKLELGEGVGIADVSDTSSNASNQRSKFQLLRRRQDEAEQVRLGSGADVPDTGCSGIQQYRQPSGFSESNPGQGNMVSDGISCGFGEEGTALSDSSRTGRQERQPSAFSNNKKLFARTDFERLTTTEWLLECTFCRGDDGLPCGLDGVMIPGVTTEKVPNRTSRLKALGNSVVPQLVELIGMAIMAADGD
jgi:DNA-cytosine methyltransferase